MATYEAVLLKKVKLVYTYLQNLVSEVATDDEDVEMDTLLQELEILSQIFEKLLLEFQTWLHSYNVAK